jgi:hypothetical protein
MLDKCFVLNTPMFFGDLFDSEIKPYLSEKTVKKIIVTGENSHPELLEKVESYELP